MFDISLSAGKWTICVVGVQGGGTAIVYFPNGGRYSYELGFGSAEQFGEELGVIHKAAKEGLRAKRLGQLARRIKVAAYSYRRL